MSSENPKKTRFPKSCENLGLELADKEGRRWAREHIKKFHYLRRAANPRSSPLTYLILLDNKPVGCLIFGRPECTRVRGWYGSVDDVNSGKCPITRWQVLNLSRIWLHPRVQRKGALFVRNAASWSIAQALKRVPYDYLIHKPPVFLNQPYRIRECISYCNSSRHRGTVYVASNFRKRKKNKSGVVTYSRYLRSLTKKEVESIEYRSRNDKRCKEMRKATRLSKRKPARPKVAKNSG